MTVKKRARRELDKLRGKRNPVEKSIGQLVSISDNQILRDAIDCDYLLLPNNNIAVLCQKIVTGGRSEMDFAIYDQNGARLTNYHYQNENGELRNPTLRLMNNNVIGIFYSILRPNQLLLMGARVNYNDNLELLPSAALFTIDGLNPNPNFNPEIVGDRIVIACPLKLATVQSKKVFFIEYKDDFTLVSDGLVATNIDFTDNIQLVVTNSQQGQDELSFFYQEDQNQPIMQGFLGRSTSTGRLVFLRQMVAIDNPKHDITNFQLTKYNSILSITYQQLGAIGIQNFNLDGTAIEPSLNIISSNSIGYQLKSVSPIQDSQGGALVIFEKEGITYGQLVRSYDNGAPFFDRESFILPASATRVEVGQFDRASNAEALLIGNEPGVIQVGNFNSVLSIVTPSPLPSPTKTPIASPSQAASRTIATSTSQDPNLSPLEIASHDTTTPSPSITMLFVVSGVAGGLLILITLAICCYKKLYKRSPNVYRDLEEVDVETYSSSAAQDYKILVGNGADEDHFLAQQTRLLEEAAALLKTKYKQLEQETDPLFESDGSSGIAAELLRKKYKQFKVETAYLAQDELAQGEELLLSRELRFLQSRYQQFQDETADLNKKQGLSEEELASLEGKRTEFEEQTKLLVQQSSSSESVLAFLERRHEQFRWEAEFLLQQTRLLEAASELGAAKYEQLEKETDLFFEQDKLSGEDAESLKERYEAFKKCNAHLGQKQELLKEAAESLATIYENFQGETVDLNKKQELSKEELAILEKKRTEFEKKAESLLQQGVPSAVLVKLLEEEHKKFRKEANDLVHAKLHEERVRRSKVRRVAKSVVSTPGVKISKDLSVGSLHAAIGDILESVEGKATTDQDFKKKICSVIEEAFANIPNSRAIQSVTYSQILGHFEIEDSDKEFETPENVSNDTKKVIESAISSYSSRKALIPDLGTVGDMPGSPGIVLRTDVPTNRILFSGMEELLPPQYPFPYVVADLLDRVMGEMLPAMKDLDDEEKKKVVKQIIALVELLEKRLSEMPDDNMDKKIAVSMLNNLIDNVIGHISKVHPEIDKSYCLTLEEMRKTDPIKRLPPRERIASSEFLGNLGNESHVAQQKISVVYDGHRINDIISQLKNAEYIYSHVDNFMHHNTIKQVLAVPLSLSAADEYRDLETIARKLLAIRCLGLDIAEDKGEKQSKVLEEIIEYIKSSQKRVESIGFEIDKKVKSNVHNNRIEDVLSYIKKIFGEKALESLKIKDSLEKMRFVVSSKAHMQAAAETLQPEQPRRLSFGTSYTPPVVPFIKKKGRPGRKTIGQIAENIDRPHIPNSGLESQESALSGATGSVDTTTPQQDKRSKNRSRLQKMRRDIRASNDKGIGSIESVTLLAGKQEEDHDNIVISSLGVVTPGLDDPSIAPQVLPESSSPVLSPSAVTGSSLNRASPLSGNLCNLFKRVKHRKAIEMMEQNKIPEPEVVDSVTESSTVRLDLTPLEALTKDVPEKTKEELEALRKAARERKQRRRTLFSGYIKTENSGIGIASVDVLSVVMPSVDMDNLNSGQKLRPGNSPGYPDLFPTSVQKTI